MVCSQRRQKDGHFQDGKDRVICKTGKRQPIYKVANSYNEVAICKVPKDSCLQGGKARRRRAKNNLLGDKEIAICRVAKETIGRVRKRQPLSGKELAICK